jgi:hypothetical protein
VRRKWWRRQRDTRWRRPRGRASCRPLSLFAMIPPRNVFLRYRCWCRHRKACPIEVVVPVHGGVCRVQAPLASVVPLRVQMVWIVNRCPICRRWRSRFEEVRIVQHVWPVGCNHWFPRHGQLVHWNIGHISRDVHQDRGAVRAIWVQASDVHNLPIIVGVLSGPNITRPWGHRWRSGWRARSRRHLRWEGSTCWRRPQCGQHVASELWILLKRLDRWRCGWDRGIRWRCRGWGIRRECRWIRWAECHRRWRRWSSTVAVAVAVARTPARRSEIFVGSTPVRLLQPERHR